MYVCIRYLFSFAGDGISIPCSYTSYVVPISSPKLHADLTSTEIKQKVLLTFFTIQLCVLSYTSCTVFTYMYLLSFRVMKISMKCFMLFV